MEYRYEVPPGMPEVLGEAFLTEVRRLAEPGGDSIAPSLSRVYSYTYDRTGLDPMGLSNLASRYLDFYKTYIGCNNRKKMDCGAPANVRNPGNPCWAAAATRDDFWSRAADNITTVRFDGEVELESRYGLDPFAPARFDKVLAQRYGSTAAEPAQSATDNTGYTWLTTQPLFVLDYVSGGSAEATDPTEAWLEPEIASRYGFEVAPSLPIPKEVVCAPASGLPPSGDGARCLEAAVGAPGTENLVDASQFICDLDTFEYTSGVDGQEAFCAPDRFAARQAELPGAKQRPYYDIQRVPSWESLKILRSHLSCNTLAAAATLDVYHNDNMLTGVPNPGTISSHRYDARPVVNGCITGDPTKITEGADGTFTFGPSSEREFWRPGPRGAQPQPHL